MTPSGTSAHQRDSEQPLDYAAAGVDVAAGDRAVELLRTSVARTRRPEVVGGLGGFAGLFALDLEKWRRPLLASSADGVGTKIAIARAMGVHSTIGLDLVAMVVDDLVCCGAEPLFLLDYVACGKLDPQWLAELVGGVAQGCELAGCALVGGETAEHPGLMAPGEYDLAGFAVGAVEADAVLGPERVQAGDAVVAMAASGLHSNGYSLVRAVLERQGWTVGTEVAEVGGPIGPALLEPTRIYAADCLTLARSLPVRVFAHVTGGGIAANLARVIPTGLVAEVDRGGWSPPVLFGVVARAGDVTQEAAEATLNQGAGMLAVLPDADAQRAVDDLQARGVPAWLAGMVSQQPDRAAPGAARLVGRHPG